MAKGRGGIRQRLAEQAVPNVASKLAQYLITSWAWGGMSPQQVQQISHLAKQDLEASGIACDILTEWDMLASIGSYGAHPNNCHRDLLTKLTPSKIASPSEFSLPMKCKGVQASVTRQQTAFWPHEMFASLYHN